MAIYIGIMTELILVDIVNVDTCSGDQLRQSQHLYGGRDEPMICNA